MRLTSLSFDLKELLNVRYNIMGRDYQTCIPWCPLVQNEVWLFGGVSCQNPFQSLVTIRNIVVLSPVTNLSSSWL